MKKYNKLQKELKQARQHLGIAYLTTCSQLEINAVGKGIKPASNVLLDSPQ